MAVGAQVQPLPCTGAEAGKGGQEPLSKKEISPCPGFPNCNNFPWANQGGARQTHQIRKVNTRRGRGRRRRAQIMQPPPKASNGRGVWVPRLSPCRPSQNCPWEGGEDTVPASPTAVKPSRLQRAALKARWPERIATCSPKSIPFLEQKHPNHFPKPGAKGTRAARPCRGRGEG